MRRAWSPNTALLYKMVPAVLRMFVPISLLLLRVPAIKETPKRMLIPTELHSYLQLPILRKCSPGKHVPIFPTAQIADPRKQTIYTEHELGFEPSR